MNKIPIIGVAIVNGFHWIQRLVDSIDHPVENLVIINNNGRGELTEDLRSLAATPHNFISKVHIIEMPCNLGVAASWNLVIKSNINAPYWLIANHDTAFTPGLLDEFYDKAQDPNIGLVFGSGGDFNDGAYDLFLIKECTVRKLGLFDENFYPAYCEDIDYLMRRTRWNWDNPEDIINIAADLKTPYYHGDALSNEPEYYSKGGAQTKKISTDLSSRLDQIHFLNWEYMYKKWGDQWRNTHPQTYPMNIQGMPLTYTTFDLDYARQKYLGF